MRWRSASAARFALSCLTNSNERAKYAFLALWALVLAGVVIVWRRQRTVAVIGLSLIVIAALLAVGTAGTFAASFNRFLVDTVPFFAGYREPQKFVMVIVLVYAYFSATAVAAITQQFKGDQKAERTLANCGRNLYVDSGFMYATYAVGVPQSIASSRLSR